MHAVGFYHEQNRPDRDEHIETTEYEKYHKNLFNMVGEYDVCSLMHYSGPSIVPKKCETWNCADCPDCYYCDIGLTRPNFTEQDVQKINLYYGCNEIGKLHYVTLPTDGMWTVVAFT